MIEKKVKTRIQQKHDIEANWLKAAAFIPLKAEIVVYDKEIDSNGNALELPADRYVPYAYERFKIGDGITSIVDLPFAVNYEANGITYRITKSGSTIKLVGSDGSETSVVDNTFDLNLTDGEGTGSIVQKNGGVSGSSVGSTVANAKATGRSAIALNARTEAHGDCSIAQGYNAKAYTKGDAAFNLGAAGLTASEFGERYPEGYNLNGELLDYESYKLRVVNGAFACAGGIAKGDRSFSTGLQSTGTGSHGDRSATFGEKTKTTVEAKNSLAGGISVTLGNGNSIAYGRNLVSPKRDFVTAIFGQFNKSWHDDEGEPTYTTLFEIGNGTSDSAKSNAFLITNDSRAKVFGAPRYANDAFRLGDLKTHENGSLKTNNKTVLGAINELKDEALKDVQWNDKSIVTNGVAKFNLNVANGSAGTRSLAANSGRAQADYAFSAGYQPTGQGSFGKFSTTLGQSCKTTEDAVSSLAGGTSTAIYGPNSIAYGRSLVSPGRKITLENGTESYIATATFGQFNKSYHPAYKTIVEIGNGINDSNQSNAFEVLWDGRAKVFNAPQDDNDVVRLEDIKNLLKLIEGLDESKITALNKFAKSLSEEM